MDEVIHDVIHDEDIDEKIDTIPKILCGEISEHNIPHEEIAAAAEKTSRVYPMRYLDYLKHMKTRRYSRRTIESYSSSLVQANTWFLTAFDIPIEQITETDAAAYFLYLTETKKASYSLVRIHHFSMQYYFTNVLKKPFFVHSMHDIKKSTHLPRVKFRHTLLTIFNN